MKLDYPLKFNHLGYATQALEMDLMLFKKLGYKKIGNVFVDNKQGVRGCFLEGIGPRLELLENLKGSDTLTPWLECGIKVYHFAYKVNDILASIDFFKKSRAIVISDPKPSVAFEGKKITFVMLRNKQLIELIEE